MSYCQDGLDGIGNLATTLNDVDLDIEKKGLGSSRLGTSQIGFDLGVGHGLSLL